MKPDSPLTATQLDLYQSYAAHDPDKLTHSERRLVATIDALRTQLEQAQGDLGDVRAKNRELATRETALREALGKLEVICAQPPSTERRGANAILAKVMGEGWLDGFTGGWQALASYIQFEVLNHEGHTLEEIKAARALSGEQGKTI